MTKSSLAYWRKTELEKCKEFPPYLFYLSRKENFESILKNGILSQTESKKIRLSYKSFADPDVQELRSVKGIFISNKQKCNLHDLVPLYFKAKTPTSYKRKAIQKELFFCKISIKKLISNTNKHFAFTDGNATNLDTKQYWDLRKLGKLEWKIINADSWHDKPDGKRIRNAEFLIQSKIEKEYIFEFSVNNNDLKNELENILKKKQLKIPVTIDERCFFTT